MVYILVVENEQDTIVAVKSKVASELTEHAAREFPDMYYDNATWIGKSGVVLRVRRKQRSREGEIKKGT